MEATNSGGKTSETKYERLRRIGIGSYGVVFKCVNRQTGQIVAIKRYSENDSDPVIRKIAMREVRMLRQLKHPNLIQLLEVFRRKRILHLVFDYCELTVLDVIERYANTCPLNLIRKIIWQLVNGVSHCHSHNCIHRDIKPENILINQAGIVKLCDFGFARNLNNSIGKLGPVLSSVKSTQQHEYETAQMRASTGQTNGANKENLLADRQALTEYVATRWYRAPELLVGDIYYDIKIDIWAVGCVAAELMRGEPLWPGKTDLEQLRLIKNSLGQLTPDQTHNLLTRGLYEQSKIERLLSQREVLDPLHKKLPERVGQSGTDFVLACLEMDPVRRPTSDELLKHDYIHSTLMGQFVRGAVPGHSNGGGPLQRIEHNSAISAHQKPVGHRMLVRHPADPVGRAQVVHRSNSQAILRAAAGQQQPPSKRLVVGAEISTDVQRRSELDSIPDSLARVSLRSAGKQNKDEPTSSQPKMRRARYKSRDVPRSQSQATALHETGINGRDLSRERLGQPAPNQSPQLVLQPRRTNESTKRPEHERSRSTQRNSSRENKAATSRANRTTRLADGNHQPARNATDNSTASTSNSTRSSISPSSMSIGRRDKLIASSLLAPAENGTHSSD